MHLTVILISCRCQLLRRGEEEEEDDDEFITPE
jgi:hypothetical protein